jgi:hypothetical protein
MYHARNAMADAMKSSLTNPAVEIQIVGLNINKTQRTLGSYTVYQVYFQLSDSPPLIWREIFGREWKDVNAKQDAGVDGAFLVMHCPLREIAITHLPALKKAVAATNTAHKQYVREQDIKREHQAEAYNDERKSVEDLAKSLHYE